MNLLFPTMLAGFLGLSVPIVLHLIARSRFPVHSFPSIQHLRYEKRDNVFARRFVDPWQLLLRLLVLSLLVFAMSRVFLPGLSDKTSPRNLIVIVDGSASMGTAAGTDGTATVFDKAKSLAGDMLSKVERPSRCALLSVGDDLRVQMALGPDPQPALTALETLQPGDGSGPGLVSAIAQACEMLRGRREVDSQVVVLTDLRSSGFQTRKQRDLETIGQVSSELGKALKITMVDMGAGDTENVAIVDAYLLDGSARIGDDCHVITRVRNLGQQERSAKPLLTVAGIREPQTRELTLQPGEEAVIDLTSRVTRSVRSFATIMLPESDAMPLDNVFSVPFVVADNRRILIINGAGGTAGTTSSEAATLAGMGDGGQQTAAAAEDVIDGAKILQYALNPARELGCAYGTGVDVKVITPEALPAEALSRYDIIILYDVSSLGAESRRDLDTFVRQGKAAVFICSAKTNPVDFNSTFAAADPKLGALAPAEVGVDRSLEPASDLHLSFATPSPTDSHVTCAPGPWLAPFRDRRMGLSVVQLAQVRDIRDIEPQANVLLQGANGSALAVEAARGSGRVLLLGFGMEISRGNLAMTKVFPPLMWRLVDYLTGRLDVKPSDRLVASEPAVLDVSESAFGLIEEVQVSPALQEPRPVAARTADAAPQETSGSPATADAARTLKINRQKTVMVDGLPVGHYKLHKNTQGREATGYFRPITVNHDPRQSDMDRIGQDELAGLFGSSASLVKPEQLAAMVPTGYEAWPALLLLLVVAYLVEAISAYVTGVLRQKRIERQDSLAGYKA